MVKHLIDGEVLLIEPVDFSDGFVEFLAECTTAEAAGTAVGWRGHFWIIFCDIRFYVIVFVEFFESLDSLSQTVGLETVVDLLGHDGQVFTRHILEGDSEITWVEVSHLLTEHQEFFTWIDIDKWMSVFSDIHGILGYIGSILLDKYWLIVLTHFLLFSGQHESSKLHNLGIEFFTW